MWDASLALNFQLMKSYFGRARGQREVSHLFKPSFGGYYPQYMLTENYCLNNEGLNEFQICLIFEPYTCLSFQTMKISIQDKYLES